MEKTAIKFSDIVSREERHYCAYLFAWLLNSPQNIRLFFENHQVNLFDDINSIDFNTCELYYEYTAIRELIHKTKSSNLKDQANQKVFGEITGKGDIQKKKADFAFYFPSEKILIITEAKFEMDYDKKQFNETIQYGEFLKENFPKEISEVKLNLVGLEFYNKKYPKLSSISWERITEIIDVPNIKSEIKKGLNYQKTIHKRAMQNWSIL